MFLIVLLVIIYSVSMTFIKNEDFIGSYYSVNIRSDYKMEICGTTASIIDQKKDGTIISNIDSMIVTEDAIYGICKKKYFLLPLKNRKAVYSLTPMPQYSSYTLLSPMEYYEEKTNYIDIIGFVVLFCGIIFTIKVIFFHVSDS